MNKSKKYKYFRKNRDNEYRKHKTRKIQYGGNKFTNFFKRSGTGSNPSLEKKDVKTSSPWFSREKKPEEAEKKPQNEGEKKTWRSFFTRQKNKKAKQFYWSQS